MSQITVGRHADELSVLRDDERANELNRVPVVGKFHVFSTPGTVKNYAGKSSSTANVENPSKEKKTQEHRARTHTHAVEASEQANR